MEYQFQNSDINYLQDNQEDSTKVRTEVKNLLAIDQDKAGVHLQAYFSCFLLLFKELN